MSKTPDPIRLLPLPGIPLVAEGDDLAALLLDAAARAGVPLAGGHLVVAQKIVSKAEGRVVALSDVEPSEKARRLAAEEGILCGISSGAAVCAAIKYAKGDGKDLGLIVVIIPSFGERYIQTKLFDPFRYDGSDDVGA